MSLKRFRSRAAAAVLVTTLLTSAGMFAAKHDKKQHNDAFMPGDVDESRIARQVRHQLLMLPYYGVFDDLAFRVDGGTVTLLGAVTRPTLKAEGHFDSASNMASVGITGRGLPPHTLAYVLHDIAAGLRELAVGLRATYILLEDVKEMLRRSAGPRV